MYFIRIGVAFMLFAELMTLFAQGRFQPGGGPGGGGAAANGTDAAFGIGVLVFYGFFILLAIIVNIFFLLTMSRALQACAPENRTMEPGSVWLVFIPLVGIVFLIMMLFKVPDSLQNEYRDRGIRGDGNFGKNEAIWYLVGAFLCPIVSLVFFIIFWNKIAGYTAELNSRGGARGDDDDDDDRDDDRPRRRRKPRDLDEDEDDLDDDRPRRRRPRDED